MEHPERLASGIRSTPSTCFRWSRCAAASGPRRRPWSGPPPSTARSGCGRSCCARRSTGSSRTACWRRSGARRCGLSPTTWPPSRRSTTRSATAPVCAGRSWARSSPTGSPAARPACATSWRSSDRHCGFHGRKLTDVPELTDGLVDKIVAQSDAQAAGRSGPRARAAPRRLPRRGPAGPARAPRRRRRGARRLRACAVRAGHPGGVADGDDCRGRCACTTLRVPPEWVDYNGHAHESRYLQVFGDATDALLRYIGIDAAYLDAGGSYYTVETHLSHLREASAGERLHVTTSCSASTPSGCTSSTSSTARTTTRCWPRPSRCFCTSTARNPARALRRPEILDRIAKIAAAHAALPRPDRAGRAIRVPETQGR